MGTQRQRPRLVVGGNKWIVLALVFALLGAYHLAAQTNFQQVYLFSFASMHSVAPTGLLRASDGYYYGVTRQGGSNRVGSIFRFSSDGVFTEIHSFDSTDGSNPQSTLIQASDGYIYGLAIYGGAADYGAIFRVSPAGQFSYFSTGPSNKFLPGSLFEGSDGNFYGMSIHGGETDFAGTLFRLTRGGEITTLVSLDWDTFGSVPNGGALVQANDGCLYGSLSGGGLFHSGTIVKVNLSGGYTIFSFDGTNGSNPGGKLLIGNDGNVYGTTGLGNGTIFRLDLQGNFSTVATFNGTNGSGPDGLIQAADGNFYGVTGGGGDYGWGTVFQFGTNGIKTLYSFGAQGTYFVPFGSIVSRDGQNPSGLLMQAADGSLYGTSGGGPPGYSGAIYRIAIPPVSKFNMVSHLGDDTTQLGLAISSIHANILQRSIDLVNWTSLNTFPPTNGIVSFVDTNAGPRCFYRMTTQ